MDAILPENVLALARPWLLFGAAIVVALIAAFVIHRMLIAVLRRLARRKPFTTAMTRHAYRASQVVLMLLAVRMVLSGTPEDFPFLVAASYVVSVSLILAMTWLVHRCVHAISATVVSLNPYDVVDNLRARRILTQTRVLTRSAHFIIALLGLSFVLLTLPGARQFGASLLASAGVAGLVAGIAARPVLGNFIAGLQIAFTQPIRIDDVLIVQGEWGRVEEITGAFVVVRIWDERRLIVPLQWFIENPFENWTHTSSTILGTVFLWLDFSVPLDKVRTEFERVCHANALWDQRVCVMHVVDTTDRAMQIRLLVSAIDSGTAFELRCQIREAMLSFVAARYPEGLPRVRAEMSGQVSSQAPADLDGTGRIADAYSAPIPKASKFA
jgi:small-conductance mechanosensitive channel